MHSAEFKQLLHPGSQFPVANGCEVVEGEELKVFSEVAWKCVESLQNPSHHINCSQLKKKKKKMHVYEQISEFRRL